jgi:predicted Rossmann fold flavoprotein
MAAIWAGQGGATVTVLDGADKIGTKILIAGGGRCNVTHHAVSPDDYAGSSRNAIRKVLLRFDVPETIRFFAEWGVGLKREETGKLFPTTNRAQTVLDALLRATQSAGVTLQHPARVEQIERVGSTFVIRGAWGELQADRVVLATGGRSLPQSGSDGGGYRLAQALGHTVTQYVFPALVPLTLPAGHPLTALSGITLPATLTLQNGKGKRLVTFTESTLLTHFGLSGPAPLNISRYWIDAKRHDPGALLTMHFYPGVPESRVDSELMALGSSTVYRYLTATLPDRLARHLCEVAGLPLSLTGAQLGKEKRLALVKWLTAYPLPISGDRGFHYAEVTAGGIPLSEIHLETMESRVCPGVYVCGELCDVDGRIGGFNFQWAWASGYVAGLSAAGE